MAATIVFDKFNDNAMAGDDCRAISRVEEGEERKLNSSIFLLGRDFSRDVTLFYNP